MTLLELEMALARRGLGGVSIACWDTLTPTWTASAAGHTASGLTLHQSVQNLLNGIEELPREVAL